MTAEAIETPAAAQFLEVGQLRAATTETGRREVVGLAVPYGEDLDRPDWLSGAVRQRFAPGAAKVRDNAALFYGHDHLSDGLPIGRITAHDHTDDGLQITARISETAKGEEVYTLLRDGVLDRFSIGFYGGKAHLEDDAATLVHDEVDVFEVSIVPDPAYKTARIDSVLSHQPHTQEADTTMTETTTAPEGLATVEDVHTLSASIDNLERRIATLGTAEAAGETVRAPGNSYGEFLKMAARGDREALDFLAFVGGTVGDLGDHVKDGWAGNLLRLIEKPRKIINLFGVSALPAEGLTVEYGKVQLESDTTQVAEQAAEGDTLVYGKFSIGTATAPVKTYGGWTDYSRQVVERSSFSYVETAWTLLAQKYAAVTEAAVKATVANVANSTEVGTAAHDLTTASGWVAYLVDAAMHLEGYGAGLDAIVVSPDMFAKMAVLRDGTATGGDFVMSRDGGSINLTGLSANLYNVPVLPVPDLAANTVRGVNTEAVKVWEAGGAPFRLQDGDITNLTQAMSLYGYMAHGVVDVRGITRPNDGVA